MRNSPVKREFSYNAIYSDTLHSKDCNGSDNCGKSMAIVTIDATDSNAVIIFPPVFVVNKFWD